MDRDQDVEHNDEQGISGGSIRVRLSALARVSSALVSCRESSKCSRDATGSSYTSPGEPPTDTWAKLTKSAKAKAQAVSGLRARVLRRRWACERQQAGGIAPRRHEDEDRRTLIERVLGESEELCELVRPTTDDERTRYAACITVERPST